MLVYEDLYVWVRQTSGAASCESYALEDELTYSDEASDRGGMRLDMWTSRVGPYGFHVCQTAKAAVGLSGVPAGYDPQPPYTLTRA